MPRAFMAFASPSRPTESRKAWSWEALARAFTCVTSYAPVGISSLLRLGLRPRCSSDHLGLELVRSARCVDCVPELEECLDPRTAVEGLHCRDHIGYLRRASNLVDDTRIGRKRRCEVLGFHPGGQ